ncbi:MAG: hypothetical protein LBD06_05270 [Candidatus Accumulibacter sp.]|jgi:hypothetical protein|nr:hypothetical protein [Accumulibacter sp.]
MTLFKVKETPIEPIVIASEARQSMSRMDCRAPSGLAIIRARRAARRAPVAESKSIE